MYNSTGDVGEVVSGRNIPPIKLFDFSGLTGVLALVLATLVAVTLMGCCVCSGGCGLCRCRRKRPSPQAHKGKKRTNPEEMELVPVERETKKRRSEGARAESQF